MNCDEFRELVHAVAGDEELDRATMESALGHAESCASCDALLAEFEMLTSELHSLAAHYDATEAPARIEAELMAAVRHRQEPSTGRSAKRMWLLGATGVAAALVLALVLGSWSKATGYLSSVEILGHGAKTGDTGGTLQQAEAPAAADLDDEQSTDSFVPLSGAYDLASLNNAPIVRVTLSGDDLASLGVPVSENDDEQVVADLIIANDGTPQAIRVVSW